MSLEYIRKYYGVPAKRGAQVRYKGTHGIITGSRGAYIRVRLEGEKRSLPYHPTDVEWRDLPGD